MVEKGSSAAEAIRAAGYSEAIAKQPHKVMKAKSVVTLKAKLMRKHKLDLNLALKIIEDASKARKTSVDKETGDIIETDVPDHTTRLKASDRIRAILDEDITQHTGTVLAKDNPDLVKAMGDADEVELQRIVFSKKDDSQSASDK